MPFYDYKCPQCGATYFANDPMKGPQTPCPKCGHKKPEVVFHPTPFVAKKSPMHPQRLKGKVRR